MILEAFQGWRTRRKLLRTAREIVGFLSKLDFNDAVKFCQATPPITQFMVETLLKKDIPEGIYIGMARWLGLPDSVRLNHSQKRQAMLIYVLEGKAADGSTV